MEAVRTHQIDRSDCASVRSLAAVLDHAVTALRAAAPESGSLTGACPKPIEGDYLDVAFQRRRFTHGCSRTESGRP